MKESKIDLRKNKINKNRINLIDLIIEYQSIDSFKNFLNRIKQNSHKKSIISFLGIIVFDLVIFLVGVFFFDKSTILIIVVWIIMSIITFCIIKNEELNLGYYRNEFLNMRDEDICKILRNKGINSTNIKEVIDYFILELEPVNTVYKESPISKSVSSFLYNLFFFAIRNYNS